MTLLGISDAFPASDPNANRPALTVIPQGPAAIDALVLGTDADPNSPSAQMAAGQTASIISPFLPLPGLNALKPAAAAEATASTVKLASGAQEMVAGTQNGILLGTVENGQVNLFRTAAGQIEGHADLLKSGLVSPGAQGFSIGVKNGQVTAIFQNSILNPAPANYLLPAQTTQQILRSLGATSVKLYP